MASSSVFSRLSGAFVFAAALAACGSSGAVTAGESATATSSEPVQAEPTPATQAAELVTRWTIIVTERFERSRAFKSDSTDELFDQFMSVGAVRAIKDKAGADKLREADAVVDRFARTAIEAAKRSADGSIEVTDEAVTVAVKQVCPAYPFC